MISRNANDFVCTFSENNFVWLSCWWWKCSFDEEHANWVRIKCKRHEWNRPMSVDLVEHHCRQWWRHFEAKPHVDSSVASDSAPLVELEFDWRRVAQMSVLDDVDDRFRSLSPRSAIESEHYKSFRDHSSVWNLVCRLAMLAARST